MPPRPQPDPAQQRMYEALRERVARQQGRRHEQIRRLVAQHRERGPRSGQRAHRDAAHRDAGIR